MMKRAVLCFALLFCLTAVSSAAETVYAARTTPVFSSPGGAELGRIYAGAALSAEAETDGFRRIRLAGLSGFAEASRLSVRQERDESISAQVYSPYGTETVVLRSAPSDSCSAVSILRAGEKVRVLGVFGRFRFVKAQAGSGFLSSDEMN